MTQAAVTADDTPDLSIHAKAKDRSFVVLDGLRGLAAIAVVTRHLRYFHNPLFESYLAVDFFFVLSGFVLAHAYGRRLRNDLSAVDFIKIRLVRLYPLYGLSILLSAALFAATTMTARHPAAIDHPILAFALAVLFLPTPSVATATLFPLNALAWSLFFELVANTFWASVWRRIQDIHLGAFVGAMGLALTVAVMTRSVGFGYQPDAGVMDNGYQWGSICAGFIRVGYSFFCGLLLYRLWVRSAGRFRVPTWLPFLALILSLAAKPPADWQSTYDVITTIFVLPLIVLAGANTAVKGHTAKACSVLGIASYGVYILQVPLVDIFRRTHHMLGFSGGYLTGAICVAFLFGFTLAADRYFDRPIRKYLTGRLIVRPRAIRGQRR